jgi:outer membrane protein OmpA-like peptidoglycan-associated protein
MKTSFRFFRSLLMAITLILVCQYSQGQFLKRLKDKVKQTAADHVTNDAGNATDKTIDKTEGAATKGGNSSSSNNSSNSSSDNNVAAGSANSSPAPLSIKAFQNYDFVPGDTVLFADDFTEDQVGEFPSHWNLTAGQAVVNLVAGKPAFCFTDGNFFHVDPRMKKASYLTDPFTIEFDTYCDENNSEQGSPILTLYYTNKDGNKDFGRISFNKGDLGGRGDVSLSGFPSSDLSADLSEALRNHYPNNWHHIAVIYKNNQLKCYVDQYRVLVIPNLNCTPTAFAIEGGGNLDHPVVISNVRVAAGGNMNMIGKKFTEAKIVTHGITFDIDKSNIKPESMGTLNMIVGVLKSNPDLKFEINGHTDNTGDAAHNLTLSQQRADAVKTQLVSMGIDGSRLSTKGFGDTKPISDNSTPEGKANNRRVEFVKM